MKTNKNKENKKTKGIKDKARRFDFQLQQLLELLNGLEMNLSRAMALTETKDKLRAIFNEANK